MAQAPSAAVLAAFKKHAVPADNRDRLIEIKAVAQVARDLEAEIKTLEERIAEKSAGLRAIYYDKLPALMSEVGISEFTLSPTGNQPAVEFSRKKVYRASISVEWPEERQAAAYGLLKRLKAEALIKARVTAELPKGGLAKAKKLIAAAKKLGVTADLRESVHHGTLSAWLKELYETRKKSLPAADLEKIGGFVGDVVVPKEKHE